MLIRNATIKDSEVLAQLLFLVLEDIIYHFIGIKNKDEAIRFLQNFTQKRDNQYSYQNCFLAEKDEEIIGAINIYDGAKLKQLRRPIESYIDAHYKSDYTFEDETQPGELYIDSLAVNMKHQNKGIGTKMLEYIIDLYASKNQLPLGLLVDCNNPNAKKLYLKLGFKTVGTKMLAGKKREHLQFKYN